MRVTKGDTRSLDNGSYDYWVLLGTWTLGGVRFRQILGWGLPKA